jgi:hypothetical protein
MGWVTTTSVGLGYRLASRVVGVPFTPMRCILSIGTTLVKEGLRVKVSTCIGNQRRRSSSASQSRLFHGMRVTLTKTIRWAAKGGKKIVNGSKTKTKRNCGCQEDIIEEAHDVVTMDAGLKYQDLAERRLNAARSAFEAAAVELRQAERGMNDAENYVKSLRSHCKSKAKNIQLQHHELFNDVVLVEHAA